MSPGFSERTFEFCYNAEYCQINAALLATHPHIPSQRAERDLGYDVEFRINSGHYTRSLFLQHKVSSFAEVRAGRNVQFYAAHGQPYFRFPVDNEQHNVLCELSRTRGNAFYCAPRFHLSHELETNFRGASIAPNAILLDPLDIGDIADNERHNITYDAFGQNPTLHSEPRRFQRAYGGGKENAPELKQQPVTAAYVEALSEELVRRTRDSKFRASVTKELERGSPTERAQVLLGRVYQVTWLLLP
ncbi:putative Adenylosuccinate lyase [Thiomonas arsenitoxydans]|jgi:hypothetical protein|uniref:Adenylosuccinate lyase n=1 Tax=Thiomonas arsenitoxydans (strain DSM 22701 / CIP 110005 / 3As) TaxID=426114 RepID=D6CUF6_THIA3|nr:MULTISPECIES: hypothetical protein [Thiomonas]MBN8745805.1 adenylosuccinate lyase [Thiomonas arsenitoxydans]ODU92829.1 MAG: adenylosuccinate lyase [Thiomonas sp. SCN 64-16]CAZ88925.1 putative Adenylosuccinate lyase [Thiomonas arsenitoxydans]CQR29392.1 putative Adenylosuccinate lyase [Thiomonas arsenitoxydans]CQR35019.1 putative Adenylosuccinate lyase [Thiomonas arsenitoxydans]